MKKVLGFILFCLLAISGFSQSVSGVWIKSSESARFDGRHVLVLQNSTSSSIEVTIFMKMGGQEEYVGSGSVPANNKVRITLNIPYTAGAEFVIR